MSDKFSIDDILAEIGSDKDVSKETAKSAGTADKKAPSQSTPGATMILNSIDEKKKTQGKEIPIKKTQKKENTNNQPKKEKKQKNCLSKSEN